MSGTVGGLTLGPVVFSGFEVPERVRFGGRQLVAVHVLPGGGRVVDAMGADEGLVFWSGVFAGAGAAARVRVLEQLRRDGAALPLAWEGWRYTVVVTSFQVAGANAAWVPYRLEATVVAVGDVVVTEALPEVASLAETMALVTALGGGPGLVGRLDVAAALLGSADVGVAMGAAGTLAQLVAARAFSASPGSLA